MVSFSQRWTWNRLLKEVKKGLKEKFGRAMTIGRAAHLTAPTAEQTALGRGACQFRNACMRGCPYGAYFSTQAVTLVSAAKKTGNLTLMPDSIVHEVLYDDDKGKATGVRIIDQNERNKRIFRKNHLLECVGGSVNVNHDDVEIEASS
ncbi:MAG: GMC family oxidoreductase N-terminal domain-containing protein [Gemmobacter sp.]|nr:GMC family oxidoreductase N-terminal domain-containing protein [Gemmobacter sp.]